MTFKSYLEKHRDWEAVEAYTRNQSLAYTFKHKVSGELLGMECKPDGSTVLSLGSESRVIPSPEFVSNAYGRQVNDNDMLSLFSQVLDKLERRAIPEDRRILREQMERHSRQQM